MARLHYFPTVAVRLDNLRLLGTRLGGTRRDHLGLIRAGTRSRHLEAGHGLFGRHGFVAFRDLHVGIRLGAARHLEAGHGFLSGHGLVAFRGFLIGAWLLCGVIAWPAAQDFGDLHLCHRQLALARHGGAAAPAVQGAKVAGLWNIGRDLGRLDIGNGLGEVEESGIGKRG